MADQATPKTKTLCRGCYYDMYNRGGGGAKECWSYEGATVCKRAFVHLSMVPPWNVPLEDTLTCYSRPKHVAIQPDHSQLTSDEGHVQKYDGRNY